MLIYSATTKSRCRHETDYFFYTFRRIRKLSFRFIKVPYLSQNIFSLLFQTIKNFFVSAKSWHALCLPFMPKLNPATNF